MAMKRAQILLDPEQQDELRQIARAEGKSVSAVIRDLLGLELARIRSEKDAQTKRYLDALAVIREHRESVRAARGGPTIDVDVSALIEEGREGRDARFAPR